MDMIAYHGEPKLKEAVLRRVRAHREADQIARGVYWVNGKGCAVGCTIHSDDHLDYERLLGIPHQLALAEDILFENMDDCVYRSWPARFLEAIPVGADLMGVWPKLAYSPELEVGRAIGLYSPVIMIEDSIACAADVTRIADRLIDLLISAPVIHLPRDSRAERAAIEMGLSLDSEVPVAL